MECCNKEIKRTVERKNVKTNQETINTKVVLWIVIGVLFITALFLTFKAGANSGLGVLQTTGSIAQNTANYAGMVGGC